MPNSYKGFSLRKRFFWTTIAVVLFNIFLTGGIVYSVLKTVSKEFSDTELQRKANAVFTAIDYAVSEIPIENDNISSVLTSKILEIADIHKADIFIYGLNGKFLLSNKPIEQANPKQIPAKILHQIAKNEHRFDIKEYDDINQKSKISSYSILKNGQMEPVCIVYLPYFHNEGIYREYIIRHLPQLFSLLLVMIVFIIIASYFVSHGLTRSLTNFSKKMNEITLFDTQYKPIRYYKNDELGELAKAYNKMIRQVQEQRERLSLSEKEKAWREMARQVAHEVKTPLTPMRMTIQRFQLKFDPNLPDIKEKVAQMTDSMIQQIDTVSSIASAFSQFVQMPEKQDQKFELIEEMRNILHLYSDADIHLHTNTPKIMVNMDKIYLHRIMTNLITNAIQATKENERNIINVDIECIQKRLYISVQDRGTGIEESMLQKVFEPNFSTKTSGMGLGLPMVKRMVEEYEGEITLTSRVGFGSTFKINFPLTTRS